jgi:hypothetical protein
MSRTLVVYCEQCGATEPSGTHEYLEFHCLAFCSPDCRDDYRSADEARREAEHAVAQLATIAEVMRRDKAAAKPAPKAAATHKRARAA